MRMFLVGMCDIFLILYLTTLGQFSTYRKSHLTVTDYNTLKESETKVIAELESSEKKIVDLEKIAALLEKEKELALQSAQSAKSEIESAQERIKLFKNEINKSRDKEVKARQDVENEREKVRKTEKALAEALRYKEEMQKLLEDARRNEMLAAKQSKDAQHQMQLALQKETKAFELAKKAQLEAELAKKQEAELLKIVKAAQEQKEIALIKERESKESEAKSLELLKKAQEEAKLAKDNEARAVELAEKARQEAEKARQTAIIAEQESYIAKRNEAEALKVAKIAQDEKEIAFVKERKARKAATKALEIAHAAQNEVAETRTKIETITKTADDAFNENINDKLMQFTVTIKYKNRLRIIKEKVITMQGLPVKINNNYMIFVTLDQIGLGSSFATDQYITYNIIANNTSITKMYVKEGETKIAALVVNHDVKHCLPVDDTDTFSSYMPVMLALRSQEILGVMDKLRGINSSFFVFKRDYLRMISMDELYYKNEGIRGTGDYAEYIMKGDQIVDLGGNFIGLAYKKNTILRINQLEGWQEIQIDTISARGLGKQVRSVIKS